MTGESTPRRLPIARIPVDGVTLALVLSAEEREAVRRDLDLVDLRSAEATLTLRARDGGAVGVAGRVRATLSQRCVVSLEPVAESLDEAVEMRLVPAGARDATVEDGLGPPDSYRGHAIDLLDIVREHIALGLDPYPRAPGAELTAGTDDDGAAAPSPFAALAALKSKKS